MGIQEINEQLGAIEKQYNDAVESIRNTGLKDVFKEVSETSDIEGIAWTQYVPSFNDGDPCTFTLGEVYLTFEPLTEAMANWGGHYLEEDEEEYGKWESYGFFDYSGGYGKENRKIIPGKEVAVEIQDFINGNPDLMEKLFGSYSCILVTPEEIKVEEYDCGH